MSEFIKKHVEGAHRNFPYSPSAPWIRMFRARAGTSPSPPQREHIHYFVITRHHLWHFVGDIGSPRLSVARFVTRSISSSPECLSEQRSEKNVVIQHLPCFSISWSFTLPSASLCVTLGSFCVSVWKLGTPNYRGLSIIMYLAAEMYWRTVPPWKKRTPNINWGILLLRSISMFLTVIFIPSDLNKYLCLGEKKERNLSEVKEINMKTIPSFQTIFLDTCEWDSSTVLKNTPPM